MPRRSKPTDDPINLRFRQLRGKRNQQEVAKLVGCQISEWSNYENGKRPGWDNIVKICAKVQISADWLLFGPAGSRINQPISSMQPKMKPERHYKLKKPYQER